MACRRLVTLVALMTVMMASSLFAAQREVRPAPVRNSVSGNAGLRPSTILSSSEARISGVAVTMHEPPRPVPNASVRLRTNLGKIVGTTKTSQKGEFEFVVAEAGAYYVELVDDKGRVLAVEDVGETTVSVALGHVSTTIIRVPVPLAQGAWVNAAKAILGAAASSGIAGVTTTGQPASAEQ